jgi:hypothetical protein
MRADEFDVVITQAGPARWIAGGRADPGLVAAEIARGPQVPVPPGYWGAEVITGCGHRMARSGLTAGDVAAEAARRSWAQCQECGRQLVFHAGVSGGVVFQEARGPDRTSGGLPGAGY